MLGFTGSLDVTVIVFDILPVSHFPLNMISICPIPPAGIIFSPRRVEVIPQEGLIFII
jgi:hypothetical protein